ncbi:suppressor of fused domain protein [Halomonas colorata]|uniref:Suppressor of fused domain protein n=1 Tax=Halomonas colorata TaxID=2742615 RepID=A0ABR9G3T9_9GAMM|nr:suppressor of fused domain protein [Halomonas colorata]MBE0465508.1 suppressor of fused domain protein [Halomonas colorata]
MALSSEHKAWANILREKIPVGVRVHNYWDDDESHSNAIFSGHIGEEHFASTIGLMKVEQQSHQETSVTTEVLIGRRGTDQWLGNLASTVAFFALKDGWRIAPGIIFERILELYDPNTSLPHLMFVPIFQWDDMNRVTVGKQTIFPLLAVPISEEELQLVAKRGSQTLENRWEALKTDVFDWSRESVA